MVRANEDYQQYYSHLKGISIFGKFYKKFFSSPIIYLCCRRFGKNTLEVGSGMGYGVLGSFPSNVVGIDVNPYLVESCKARSLDARLIDEDGKFPFENNHFDSWIERL